MGKSLLPSMPKRIMTALLAIVMLVGLAPMQAFADTAAGNYTGTVYISVSHDGKYLESDGDISGQYMAYVPVSLSDVAAVDLDAVGLGDFYYTDTSGGEPQKDVPNVMKLFVYAQQQYYSGKTDAFSVTGSSHSAFMNGFWGWDVNLLYYVNGDYPLDSSLGEGMGATSDAIELHDGDFVDVNGFTSWGFYSDSNAAFNYFVTNDAYNAYADEGTAITSGDITHEYAAKAGSKLTVHAVHAAGDVMSGSACSYTPKEDLAIHFGETYDDSVAFDSDEAVGTTDENGAITITMPSKPGEYIVWADGQFGADVDEDNVVSGPAMAKVMVYEEPQITTEAMDPIVAGQPYSFTVSATGYPTPTFAAEGLPEGLQIDPQTGVISGTVSTTAESIDITVTASNQYGSANKTLATSVGSVPSVVTTELPAAKAGTLYSTQLEATGIPSAYTWYLGGDDALPAGITLGSDGTLSGTPTTPGTYSFKVLASNDIGSSAAVSLTLEVGGALPAITTTSLPTVKTGQLYTATVSAEGDPETTITASGLPDGFSLEMTGENVATITGSTSTPGTYQVEFTAASSLGTDSKVLTLDIGEAPAITTESIPDGEMGKAYSVTIAAAGDPAPTFSAAGLPAGLQIDEETGAITGTPSVCGMFNVRVTATNGAGADSQKNYTLQITGAPTITTTSLPQAIAGESYRAQIEATGYPEPSFMYSGVSLPEGVTIDSTGLISGTPSEPGVYSINAVATNDIGSSRQVKLELVVAQKPEITTTTLPSARVGEDYSYQLEATGFPTSSIKWSKVNGTSWIKVSEDGTITGKPTSASAYGYVTVKAEIAGVGSVQKRLTLKSVRKYDSLSGYLYVSVTQDGEFVVSDSKSGGDIDYLQISAYQLSSIDLDKYGLGDYNWDADGDGSYEVTMLQLMIYMMENHYVDKAAGGFELAEASAPGNMQFAKFWGVSNPDLVNTVDGYVTKDSDGKAVSPDRVELKASYTLSACKEYKLNIFGNAAAKTDPAAGDNRFVDASESPLHAATAFSGVDTTFTLQHVANVFDSDTGTVSSSASPAAGYAVTVTDSAGTSTTAGTTASDGTVSINFPAAGTYKVTAPGITGSATDYAVSSPASITVTVTDRAAAKISSTTVSSKKGQVSVKLTATGNPSTFTWGVDEGSVLPEGLELATDGTLSGTLNEVGEYTFDVTCTNGYGDADKATITLNITDKYKMLEGTAYVSIAYDGKPVKSRATDYAAAGIPVCSLPVDLAEASQFDLDAHGYKGINVDFDGDGIYDLSAAQLVAYVADRYYGDGGFDISSNGWINDFWGLGIDGNVIYEKNGNTTMTATTIQIEDGDRVDFASYNTGAGWVFYTDPHAGFLYFMKDASGYSAYDGNNIVSSYDAESGKPVSVYLAHDNAYASARDVSGTTLYYAHSYCDDPEDAVGSVVTGADGSAQITFPTAGEWVVWCYGRYGVNNPTTVVTSPALAAVHVTGAPAISTTSLPDATYGEEYTAMLESDDSNATWYLADASMLPEGISVSSNGTVSGTPTQPGTYTFSVVAGNSHGVSSPTDVTLTVLGAAPQLVTESLAQAVAGQPYSATIEVSGTPTPTVEVSGLPSGLTFDSGTMAISGTCSAAGTYTVTVKASNGLEPNIEQTLELTVAQVPTVTTTSLPDAAVGKDYSATIAASGAPAPTFYAQDVDLPAGLAYSNGTVSGTPEAPGEYSLTVVAVNSMGASAPQTVTLKVLQAPEITTETLPAAYKNQDYSYQLEATGYPTSSIKWSKVNGTSWIKVSADGTITGKPSYTSNSYYVTVKAEIPGAGSVQKRFTLRSINKYEQLSGNVYVSVSKDGKFMVSDGTTANTSVDYVKIPLSSVSKIDLDEKGLGAYNWDPDGDGTYSVTMLQLMVYMLDNYYSGGSADGLTLSGSSAAGSLWITGFWGVTSPYLTYAANAGTPVDEDGNMLTADRVKLTSNSEYAFNIFTDASIYGDANIGDNYFVDEDGDTVHEATAFSGVEYSYKLQHVTSTWNSTLSKTEDVKTPSAGYTVTATNASGETVATATTDAEGVAKITFPAAGTYTVLAEGIKGATHTDSVVSSPASIKVTVTDRQAPTISSTSVKATKGAVSVKLTATGNPSDFTWTLADGSTLPEGLELASDGTISGNCSETGTYTFDVTCSNGYGDPVTATVTLEITQKYKLIEGTGYLTISYDGHLVMSNETEYQKAGQPIGSLAVDLAEASQFDLDAHGYKGINVDFDGDGIYDLSAAQMVAYVADRYYGDGGFDIASSGWINDIWGLGIRGNIIYEKNGVTTMTATTIQIEDGDRIDFSAFNSGAGWVFYTDPVAGFHYFMKDGSSYDGSNIVASYEGKAGEPLDVYLAHDNAYASMTDVGGYTIYYGRSYTDDPDQAAGYAVADENGKATITFPSSGVWKVWAYGGYGVNNPDIVVNSAAMAEVVVSGKPVVEDMTLPQAVFSQEYEASLEAMSVSDVTWFVQDSSKIPAGLSVSKDGTVSGTPTQPGIYTFSVVASNEDGTSSAANVTITVAGEAPQIVTTSLPQAMAGEEYGTTIEVSGTPAAVVEVTGLPEGMTFDAETCTISGTAAEGVYNISVNASNGLEPDASATFALVMAAAPKVITTELPVAHVGIPYEATIEATGTPSPGIYADASMLPEGLTITNGKITGTPVAEGTTTISVVASNQIGSSELTEVTLIVGKGNAEWARLPGEIRYDTMSAVIDQMFSSQSCSSIVVASGENYADSLAASGFAGMLDAPVVLTASAALSDSAAAEIARLSDGEANVYIVGGDAAVSEAVANAVLDMDCVQSVTRVSGDDRVETALGIYGLMAERGGVSDTVVIGNAWGYADALSISPWAYASSSPFFGTTNGVLNADQVAAIEAGGFTKVLVLGGDNSVNFDAVKQQLGEDMTYTRLAGESRIDTSVLVAQWATGNLTEGEEVGFQPDVELEYDGMGVVYAWNFPDALAAGSALGHSGSVMLIADDTDLSKTYLEALISANKDQIYNGYIIGGTTVLPDEVMSWCEEASKMD